MTTNIVKASFGTLQKVKTRSVYQHDYGQVLQLFGIELPTSYEVHFSNNESGSTSIIVIGDETGAKIPDSLLETGKPVYAWLFLHTGNEDGETVREVEIPVISKSKPESVTPTPHEQSVIEQAISALNDAVEATAADVQTTTANAQAAAQSEANAATSERSAAALAGAALASQNAAESASQSATESASGAAESARNAAQSATQTAESATNAQASAAQAERSAQSAESSATDAEQAKQDAQDAQEAAETAQTAAEQAAQSVSGLSEQIAQNTADIADLVQSKAGALIDTVTGSIASFVPDATVPTVRGLTVDIEPVQDLHGYDNPWPAGGGKNLFNYENTGITFASMGQSGSVFSNTNTDSRTFFNFQFRALNNGTIVVKSDAQSISSTGRKSATITISETITHVSIVHNGSQRNLSVTYPFTGQGTFTISFDVTAYDPSSVGGLSFKDVQIESGSTATAYAPYSNICPISGWDEVEVQRTGVNLLNPSADAFVQTWSYLWQKDVVPNGAVANMSFTDKDTSVDVTGCYFGFVADDLSTTSRSPKEFQWVLLNGTIANNKSNVSSQSQKFCRGVFIYPKTVETLNKIFSRWDVQVELGTTATVYGPYLGQTYTIPLGQTVYGGTLDVTNGVLTVDRAMVDLGTLSWVAVSVGNNVFYAPVSGAVDNTGSGNVPKVACTAYGTTSAKTITGWGSTTENSVISLGYDSARFYVRDARFSDATSFAHAASGVKATYPLATPITFTLTPIEISVLTGQANNIWADCGDVSVEYAADLKTYIDQKIAAAVAALS